MPRNPHKQRCTARTRAGKPCRAWAVPGTDPPRCSRHQPFLDAPQGRDQDAAAVPAPVFFATEPELITIDQAITALVDKLAHLDHLIAILARHPERNQSGLVRAIELYNQSCSRLSRLIRDRHAIAGSDASHIPAVIRKALQDLGDQWDVDLLTPRY